MKDWLSIGQFSKKSGVSARALRIYEDLGLIGSHARGENGYRYYRLDQLGSIERIKQFKSLGFSLSEIKALLHADLAMDSTRLREFLFRRRETVLSQQKIGGVMSDGVDVTLYRFNQQPKERGGEMSFKLPRVLGFSEEVAVLASLAAVLDVGLNGVDFKLSAFR